MKTAFITALAFSGLILGAGTATAVPVLNEYAPGAYYDTFPDGSSFGMYTNSGDFMFVEEGNNLGSRKTLDYVESLVRDYFGYGPDFYLTPTDPGNITWTSGGNNTGTWELVPPVGATSLYAVKAGKAFAMYQVKPPDATGSWSTYDIWISGLQGTGGNEGLEISHFAGYNATAIPEPATLLLLCTGMAGLVGIRRNNMRK